MIRYWWALKPIHSEYFHFDNRFVFRAPYYCHSHRTSIELHKMFILINSKLHLYETNSMNVMTMTSSEHKWIRSNCANRNFMIIYLNGNVISAFQHTKLCLINNIHFYHDSVATCDVNGKIAHICAAERIQLDLSKS